jgi:hypothetical protein
LAGMAMTLGVLAGPAAEASAVTCRVFRPAQPSVGGGRVGTGFEYVPGSSVSGCKDINVRDIKDTNTKLPADYCGTFQAVLYPTSGGTIEGAKKRVCSQGPNGPVVPLITNVMNGTKYRVFYDWEYVGQHYDYKIVD